jgi:hypothetical protein
MYTNAQYANPDNTSIRCDINGVTSFVPCDPANTDYARIMELVAAGELTIATYVPPPAPPVTQITMRQCRLQLLAADLLDDVDAAVAQADRAVQIEWEYATVVDRYSPLVSAIGASLGLDDATIGQLFMDAAQR